MYIKLFAKTWKNTGDLDTNSKNIQPGYRNGIFFALKNVPGW